MQERNPFDQFDEAPQQGYPGLPQGAVMLAPGNPYELPTDAAQLDSTRTSTARTAFQMEQERRNAPIAAAKAQADLRASQLAVQKAERDLAAAPLSERAAALRSLAAEINNMQRIYNAGPGQTKGLAGVSDFLPTSANSEFDTQANILEEQAAAAFKIPGAGGQSDADAARIAAANKPNRWAHDVDTERQLAALRSRVGTNMQALGEPVPQWEGLTPDASAQASTIAAQMIQQGRSEQEIRAYLNSVSPGSGDQATGLSEAMAFARANPGSTPQVAIGNQPPPAPPAPPAPTGTYQDSLLGQGMSGVNEGIASTLGLPVDAATFAMNLIPQGINAIANTNLGQIERPVAGGEWWKDTLSDVGSIFPEAGGAGSQFARRVGQSVGAAALPIGATAQTARQAGGLFASALGGGTAAATSQQVAPGNLTAEMLAELAGGGVTGLGALARGRGLGQRQVEAAIPTTNQLRDEAGSLYDLAQANGRTASQAQTQTLADRFTTIATDEGLVSPTGRVSEAYPKAREALNMVRDYSQGDMTPRQMNVLRKSLSEAAGSPDKSERRIASTLLGEFDDWTAPLAPEFADARAVSRRYLGAEELENMRGAAEAQSSAFSGSGFENAMRTQYRALDKKIEQGRARGWSPDMVEAIQAVNRGTPMSNAARTVGKLAPTGVVSGGLATGVPFAIGNTIGGPALGATASAATLGAGTLGRNLATKMTERSVDLAELTARNGGAIPQVPLMNDQARQMIAALTASQAGQYVAPQEKRRRSIFISGR